MPDIGEPSVLTRTVLSAIAFTLVSILAIACGSEKTDIASLEQSGAERTLRPMEKPNKEAVREVEVMAFSQCMRDQGVEMKDPIIDSGGNVQKPEPVEGITLDMEQLKSAWAGCEQHLDGVTFGKKGKDQADEIQWTDDLLELAECMREKDLNVDDPDVRKDGIEFEVDKNDPAVMDAVETCWEEPSKGKNDRPAR
jgi:hypothetical protein